MDSPMELADESLPLENDDSSVKDVIAAGMKSRADLSAQRKREQGARLNDGAVKSESFPSVIAFADYGALGVGVDQSIATHTVGVSLRIPVFDGGRRKAERVASLTEVREEEIRSRDLRDQAELEIRESFESLRSAKEQVKVAEEALALAHDELGQARRRYEAGVTNNLELVEAQRVVDRAEERRIDAEFNYRQAFIDLGLATGSIRTKLH